MPAPSVRLAPVLGLHLFWGCQSPACAPKGAELVGEVAQYENSCRLCYLRGPGGIIVSLAEELSS